MQVMKWSVIALAVAAGTTQMAMASSQSESKGFVEDSSLNILSRNLYINRDFHRGGDATNYSNSSDNPKGYTEEWGQGFISTFESGFTQGTVGFGVDAYGLLGLKLDSGKGRAGILEMPQGSDGRSQDDFSEAGGAVKVRVSNTVLKYGNQFTALPVFSTDDSRLLPEATTGTLLTINEIEGLEINAGRFTSLNQQWQTDRDSGEMKSINVYGASYSFTDDLSAAVYASDLEDTFKKKYANINYNLGLADEQSLNFDFNIYKTDYDKKAYGSSLDNTIWSLAAAYSMGAHTFTLAHQRSSGDKGYEYGADGGGTIWLANSVQVRDFNAEDETSWQARYDIDMSTFGVPGLSFMARYISGDDAKVGGETGVSRWERNLEAKYVVQEGVAKDLSLRVRQATVRSDQAFGSDNDLEDVRLIVEYPLSIL
ncbi:OprD family porin [Pseudomonas spirodelae]|uniref:OprD family porin n=1 Tax=Pseudomonas spirodelae TaxID=3101751 RepID=A0ABU5PCH1_9PSED|nr:OprD family porin [Pseudomonas sp. T5W1]MEA1607223.1 OprD family porin [Pseudomonas sp. T5W1]